MADAFRGRAGRLVALSRCGVHRAYAIVLAATAPNAPGDIHDVGEVRTPTVAERFGALPRGNGQAARSEEYNFDEDLDFDSTRIRTEFGCREPVPFDEGPSRTLRCNIDWLIERRGVPIPDSGCQMTDFRQGIPDGRRQVTGNG